MLYHQLSESTASGMLRDVLAMSGSEGNFLVDGFEALHETFLNLKAHDTQLNEETRKKLIAKLSALFAHLERTFERNSFEREEREDEAPVVVDL